MTKKHLVELGLFVLVAVIFVGAGTKMFLVDKVQTPQENIEVRSEVGTSTNVSVWQTYVNDEYGFELKYPNDWAVSQKFGFFYIFKKSDGDPGDPKNLKPGKNTWITFYPRGDDGSSGEKYWTLVGEKPTSLVNNNLTIEGADYYLTSGEVYASNIDFTNHVDPLTKQLPSLLMSSVENFSQECDMSKGENATGNCNVYFPHGVARVDDRKIQEQIVSSIKFIDWKTYTNNEYGFSIKYPDGWKVEEKKDTSTKNLPIFYVYKIDANTEVDLGGNVTKVMIAPQGTGHNEIILPSAKVSTFIVKNQKKGFQSFLKNGDMWAMWLQFLKQPDSWSEEGLIFYSAEVTNKLPYCELNGQKVDNNQCGYDAPGEYVMGGVLDDQADNQIAEDILSSFVFTDTVYEPDCCG